MEMIGDGDGDGGRFFGGGERRLRLYGNHPSHHASLKCPRCESVNTKFCYYNNYNLSQPRHFCKSCRRYWTKGGVLRNVPVGGGCRKNKRSAKYKSVDEACGDSVRQSKSRNKTSSSESSGLTAVGTMRTTAVTTSAEEASAAPGSQPSAVPDPSDSAIFDVNRGANLSYDRLQASKNHHGEIFEADIGSLSNVMSSSDEATGFGIVSDVIPLTTTTAPVDNPAADAFAMEGVNGGTLAAALGWGNAVDEGRFDLTAGIDPSEWSQHQWTVNDESLRYFPYI